MLDAEALDAAVDACAEDAFAYLERLVAADSTLGHEQAAVEVFAEQMTGLGFTVDLLELPADLADDPRAGVVQHTGTPRLQAVARRGPTTGPSLLLNGHIDVVPAETPERWTSPPFAPTRRDGRLFGRGAGDMKGGFAMGALALQALDQVAPDLQTGPLRFLAAIEEECTGNGTLAACRDGVLADAVVLLEPTDLGIMVGGVGILWCDLDVDGVSAHAEAAHEAVNPVDLAMRLVDGLRDWSAQLAGTHPDPALEAAAGPYNLNLGQIRAGDWGSSVPATASTRLRIAFPRAWSPGEAEQRVREEVETLAAGFPTPPRLRLSGFRASGYLLEPGHALVAAVSRAHEHAHGRRPAVFSLASTTDARTYLNDFGVPALCYGPAVSHIHGIDESVELASIVAGAKTLARFLVGYYRPEQLPA